MIAYLQQMLDLALGKELQGIHFWATVYVLFVLAGNLLYVYRVRRWPHTRGQLLRLGLQPLGAPEIGSTTQDYVPRALYTYQVAGHDYQGEAISVWKIAASGVLRGAASGLPRQIEADAHGTVTVYYHPQRPEKSVLLRPGWLSLAILWGGLALVGGYYLWRW